ncbi:hypothetical protein LOTGIDRAFT_165473 [Lottia gigantea]|uniref:C2H2-type domain-containing protein n=1 Tax=Lottia gigantea TaxID=225164 RepID=V4A173_LOTGI|nr:hypothetical protein LOTGIDRAFT_165473 [Lottia gigantea]ESO88685.1 hypothetical protein LOTGIDRAFT_165473 [Lottia gigantea]
MDKTQYNLETIEANDSVSSFLCAICQEEFNSAEILEAHNIIVHENLTFKCTACGKDCPSERYLSAHMIINHGEQVRAENDITIKVSNDRVDRIEVKEEIDLFEIIEVGSEITIPQQEALNDNIVYIESNVESVEGTTDHGIEIGNQSSVQISDINGVVSRQNPHVSNTLELPTGVISEQDTSNTIVPKEASKNGCGNTKQSHPKTFTSKGNDNSMKVLKAMLNLYQVFRIQKVQ